MQAHDIPNVATRIAGKLLSELKGGQRGSIDIGDIRMEINLEVTNIDPLYEELEHAVVRKVVSLA